jgi:O-antigen ligase
VEFYKEAIIIFLVFLAFISFYYPMINIYLIAFISLAIEGQWIENFVLFRLYGFNWYLIDLSLLIVFINLLLLLKNSLEELIINKLFLSILIFIIVVMFSAYTGIKNGFQFQAVFYDFRGFFYYLAFIPAIIILSTKNRIINFLYFIVFIITLKSIVDIYLSLFIYEKSFDIETRQLLGFARLTGYNEIVYSLSFISSFFLIIFSKNIYARLLFLFTLTISLISLFLSYTRGSWVATFFTLLIGLFFFILSEKSKINLKKIIAVITGLLIILFILNLIEIVNLDVILSRIKTISINRIDISNLGRLVEYASALEAFRANPIFGTGLGFLFVYFSPGIGPVESIYCHNSYLYVLSKMGIVGLISFLTILYFAIFPVFKIKNRLFIDRFYSIAFILILLLISISVKSFTTWHLNTNTFSPFIGILFGISIRIRDIYLKEYGR